MAGVRDNLLRALLTLVHQGLRLNRRVRRTRTFGAHAIALTPERKLILVKLRYAPGWRLPGGGRCEHEDPRDAVLRELREEIGLISHGRIQIAAEIEQQLDLKRDLPSLLLVDDVRYRPSRWSWEVEAIMEATIDDLPANLAPVARVWIEAVQHRI